MASLVLGVVGNIAAPGVGGALGAALGAYLDANIIMPGLFPTPAVEGPRLGNELKLQGNEEGSPAHYILGPLNRVAGTIIWLSDIIEVKKTTKVGGKGGGNRRKQTTYTYYVDIAVAVGKCTLSSFGKVLADGKRLYDASPDVTVSGTSCLTVTTIGTGSDFRMVVNSNSSTCNLALLQPGEEVDISGFSNPANNVSDVVVESATYDASTGGSTAVIRHSGAIAEGPGSNGTFFQDLPNFYPDDLESITFYLGTQVAADSLITAYQGAADTPSFKGTAYMVIKRLNLTKYGNRVPQFGFEVAGLQTTLAGSIRALIERGGLTSGQLDVTGVTGAMNGYAAAGPQSTLELLQPLMVFGDLLHRESEEVVTLFHRRDATVIDVLAEYLATHEEGGDAPRPCQFSDLDPSRLPDEVFLTYQDTTLLGQNGSLTERRRDQVSKFVSEIRLPIAMSAAKARGIARRILWAAWASDRLIRMSLPHQYTRIQENDVLRFSALGYLWWALVVKVDLGKNSKLEIEAIIEQRDVLTQVEEADAPDGFIVDPALGTALHDIAIFDGPGGSTTQDDVPRIAAGVAVHDPESPFQGGTLFVSEDDDDYIPFAEFEEEATIGICRTTLAGAGIAPDTWDRVTTLTVELRDGTLESADEIDVLNGFNRATVGGEVIGFAVATLVSYRTYQISTLLRGLRNTEDQMTGHGANERFMLLNDVGVVSVPYSLGKIGITRYFKYVPGGQTIADASPSFTAAYQAKNLECFSPTDCIVIRDDYGNAVVTWKRRTRILSRLFTLGAIPLGERTESYEIDIIYPSGGSTVVRTVTSTTPTFTYTEGQQTTDGVTHFTAIKLRIYQMSEIMGRGKVYEVIV